jgi:hypothetical protein
MKIFYSWQSDLPNNTNRGFIKTLSIKPSKTLEMMNHKIDPRTDKDTQGVGALLLFRHNTAKNR